MPWVLDVWVWRVIGPEAARLENASSELVERGAPLPQAT